MNSYIINKKEKIVLFFDVDGTLVGDENIEYCIKYFNKIGYINRWCSDITYIWTFEGFVYLTSIMDLYSRKIVSWVLSETLEASHVVKCIEKAKQSRHIENPLIFHCDRGCQYVSEAFHKATAGMIHSYSKKAYPWDNACIESFHALLKREWINRFKIFNYTHAYKLIFEYIETFYNTVRIHSHCGYLSPNEYEEQYLKNLETDVTNLAS